MYQVVLVEDEPLICEGLKQTVDWAGMGCQVAGEANDALEAETLICRLRPDIVLTDIRMPGVSGLQLIERVRQQVECEFIIISGYDEFSYAKQALNLGVLGYLLKPIDEAELAAAVRHAIDTIRKKRGLPSEDEDSGFSDPTAQARYLEKAEIYMQKHCAKKLTLKSVAQELDISESYLGKLFKNNLGQTFLERLTLYRMQKAVRLLMETDYRIYEIADQTGYNDPKYFSSVFYRTVGVKPIAFRCGYRLDKNHPLNRL